MDTALWEGRYLDAYDRILEHSSIYSQVKGFHVKAMSGLGTVLDSGCGTGNVTLELLKRDQKVYALDTSRKAMEMLKKKCSQYKKNLFIRNASMEILPFGDGIFDGVTSMFAMHFVVRFEGALREHFRVMRPGGTFAITGRITPGNSNLVLNSYYEDIRKKGLLPEHRKDIEIFGEGIMKGVSGSILHPHTFKEMKEILERIGFRFVREHPNPYFGLCYSITARK
ncbi:MAG: class I SAM-dependent methyltransferase [Candidatus Aenigmarchaeota archaeon]|nr:class I SAM-dependent methyltransferase [Candidatus Aenigmarchaeota archaeon]